VYYIISGGSGAREVSRAIWLYLQELKKEHKINIIKTTKDSCKNCYKSVLIYSEDEIKEGLMSKIFNSPFRPKHKRKRWYFEVKKIEAVKNISFDESKIVYQSLKSPKKGGQHVNTTNSGIRAIYKDLNLEAISFDERSQFMNKKIAKDRLLQKFNELIELEYNKFNAKLWQEAKNIQRN